MKFKSKLNRNFYSGTRTLVYKGERSDNPLRLVMDMTGHEISGRDYFIEREGYYTYLVNFTVAGGASAEYGGETFTLGAGDLVLIDCANPHKFHAGKDGWEFWFLHFSGLGAPQFYERFVRDTGYVLHGFDPALFLEKLGGIHETLLRHPEALRETADDAHPFCDEKVFTEFSEAIYAILNDIFLQLKARQSSEPKGVTAARSFIAEHFSEKITLAQIADAAYLSPYHLSRQFRRYTGMTVGAYISELRLNRAIELLSTTNKTVAEIAAACGYSDMQMLNKLFKANFSLTPTQFRKSHRDFFSE